MTKDLTERQEKVITSLNNAKELVEVMRRGDDVSHLGSIMLIDYLDQIELQIININTPPTEMEK